MFSNFTNISPNALLDPDNPRIFVGNSFLITWWQYLFDVTRCYRNLSYTPVVSICVRLGGRSAPSADRHYTKSQIPFQLKTALLWRFSVAGNNITYSGCHKMCSIFLTDFKWIWIDFLQTSPLSNFMEICPVGAALIHADRRTNGRTWQN